MLNHCVYKCRKKNTSWITFVHGAGGSSAIWFKQIRFFSKYFKPITPVGNKEIENRNNTKK